jgi:hypothetical protein
MVVKNALPSMVQSSVLLERQNSELMIGDYLAG